VSTSTDEDTDKKKAKGVRLVAKTNVKFGGKAERAPLGLGFIRTEEATTVAPGEEFEIDADEAEDLIRVGAAAMPEDYKAEQSAAETTDEKIAKMRAEVAEYDIEQKAKAGDSAAITSNAHLEAQRREEAAVAEAQEAEKKGGKNKGETKGETAWTGKTDEPEDDKKKTKKK